jgi:hypothetical protein
MEVEQSRWTPGGWEPGRPGRLGDRAHLVLAFGGTGLVKDGALLGELRTAHPRAHLLACSTAGEIFGTQVTDDALVATVVRFDATTVAGAAVTVHEADASADAGAELARALDPNGLVHVLVISDGLHVNGSALVRGLVTGLPAHVTITGGLSGDGPRFKETCVAWDGLAATRTVAAVGFYGSRLRVGHGSLGGWDPFGPERLVTRSRGNVLYAVDGRPALALYKAYLGEHADALPASGLLFPLSLRTEHGGGLVRTILAVDEAEGSMTFAGDVPEGSYVRLMKANFDRLIDGAVGAARASHERLGTAPPDLAVLISCVGRKLVLRQRVEEELEGVREVLGDRAVLTGFYSYGEISPFAPTARCELHNQTMTITTLAER